MSIEGRIRLGMIGGMFIGLGSSLHGWAWVISIAISIFLYGGAQEDWFCRTRWEKEKRAKDESPAP